MKTIVIGASGRIGSRVVKVLLPRHEIVHAGRDGGDVQVDYTQESSVRDMYEQVGNFDALICVAGGDSVFKHYKELGDEDYRYGFDHKFLSQVRLVRIGEPYCRDNGSFTLTSGFLSHYPNPASLGTGPVNAAVDSYARSAAPLLPRGLRINVVSPAPIVESGEEGRGRVTAEQAAEAYLGAVEGDFTGRVLRVWGGLPVPE
jgi:NAD(P)-dependent dehydrogenase (short-subunit alcohol dehydrogenase family)